MNISTGPGMRRYLSLKWQLLLWVLALHAPGAHLLATDNSEQTIQQVERRILSARREITSAEFVFDVNSDRRGGVTRRGYHSWIAPNGLARQERMAEDVAYVSIFNETTAFYYAGGPGAFSNPDRSRRMAIQMVPISQARAERPPFLIVNPLTIMLAPVQISLLPYYGLESLIGARGRRNFHFHHALWNGLDAIIVDFEKVKPANFYEYEVVPSRGYNIVQWRARWGLSDAHKGDELLTCEPKRMTGSIWFPEKLHLVSTRDGELYLDENVTITPVSINQPLNHDIFTLKGAGLPPNQIVVQGSLYGQNRARQAAKAASRSTTQAAHAPIGKPLLFWDGATLRPMTKGDEVAYELSKPQNIAPHAKQRLWGASALTLCGFLAVVGWMWQSWRKRPHNI
ncbi:MAG TPA: hypothetical protein VFC78_22190 [Tepidisphaeraceae bacterium]|nr:hypothetical protein [Tepidisphaeraceae bacterium]